MRLNLVLCSTMAGSVALPQAHIATVGDGRRITHLDLGIDWVLGTVPGGNGMVFVVDLARLLKIAQGMPTTNERASITHLLHLTGSTPVAVACMGYTPQRECLFRPAGSSLRGLPHIVGLAYPEQHPAAPVIHVTQALTTEHRTTLITAIRHIAEGQSPEGERGSLMSNDNRDRKEAVA